MYIFLLILCLFLLFVLILFLPVIYQQFKVINAEHQLSEQIKGLDKFYRDKLQIVERQLGLGPSQNSDIVFCDAHKNQEFAIATILNLMDQLGD